MEGCATSTYTPQDIDCYSYKLDPVENSHQRVSARGFSVLPPSGDNWCVVRPDSSLIGFSSTPYIGLYVAKRPTYEQSIHTFAVTAVVIRVKKSDITSQIALKSFMERWMEEGQPSRLIGSELHVDWPGHPTPAIDFQVETEDSLTSDCVRYRVENEERDNPRAPGWVLKVTREGIACRHPFSNKMLVSVEFSERRRKGYEDSDARKKFREQADTALGSLEFTPLLSPKRIDPDISSEQIRKLKKLATEGDARAQFQLSYYLYNIDRRKSFAWLCRSAMQRWHEAQIAVGSYYEFAVEPVEQDHVEALMWYLLGSPARRQPAYSLKQEMTTPQIDQAERMARDWMPGGCPST